MELLQNTQPPSKSKFNKKVFASNNEWIKRFLQEEEFVDVLMKMRQDANLTNVSLVRAQLQFKKYKDDGIMDKQSFMREMKELIISCAKEPLSENQKMKLDTTLVTLYRLFDIDRNGILKSDEVAAALMVLCQGSVASKLKFGIQIFSSTDTETDIKIGWGEFKTLLFFIFKLSMETGNEIMIDYPLDKLAS